MLKILKHKILRKKAIIGIYGLGYVGLPLAVCFVQAGFQVFGFDIDKEKVDKLNSGKTYIKTVTNEKIRTIIQNGFKATNDFSQSKSLDVLLICVPTPLNRNREPNLSFIKNTLNSVSPYLTQGQMIGLESTTYPGTTEEILLPIIESKAFRVGKNFFLVYSPEREDPGNTEFNTHLIPKIVGGHTSSCLIIGKLLYETAVKKVVSVSSTKVAELTKLLENIHRAVNIGLVNEMKIVADQMNIDIYEVIRAASTKPFGFTPFYPGPGIGGHCIPIDPFYLTWKAREYGIHTHFIEIAGEVNSKMPSWVVFKITDTLNHIGKSIKGSKILILGIAYKKNIDDTRESPAVEIIKLLKLKKAIVDYSDPHIIKFPKMRDYNFKMKSVILSQKNISSYDIIILTTNHDEFDYEFIQKHAKLIIDTRGVYQSKKKNIIPA